MFWPTNSAYSRDSYLLITSYASFFRPPFCFPLLPVNIINRHRIIVFTLFWRTSGAYGILIAALLGCSSSHLFQSHHQMLFCLFEHKNKRKTHEHKFQINSSSCFNY
ncbi:hypothetical protein F5Y03DRAFT_172148 [Xylaria venustula]|nr:hypothetical protein F5Y03DRAFT_172148 [Xylaria venustula]